jgi:GT2 family glycosyltransferase
VDVVIPVHNAAALVRRCVDSVFAHLGEAIRRVWIQDDASGPETRSMLDALPYSRVSVHHAPANRGFGASVNQAVARSDAPLVLVLNSDTEASEDFLPPLRAALDADPGLAGVNPAGNMFARYDLGRYARQPGGYVRLHKLLGFGFLIRRRAFEQVGGFDDAAFGRGYDDDTDLSRRLVARGWRLGVHPEARLFHAVGGSFGRSPEVRDLILSNRLVYHNRYPEARRNVLLLTGARPLEGLPAGVLQALERVVEGGGKAHWVTSEPTPRLPWLEMSSHPARLGAVVRLMRRGRRRFDKRISDVWCLPDANPRLAWLVRAWARRRGLRVATVGASNEELAPA